MAGLALIALCAAYAGAAPAAAGTRATTDGAIAVVNLDSQISRLRDEGEVIELLLVRARFLADYDALERAVALSERGDATRDGLLRRAQTRSAVHRFDEALADFRAAERAGLSRDQVFLRRAVVHIAIGRAAETIGQLEAAVARMADVTSLGALASGYAAVGRYDDAERTYAAALATLRGTSPFAYAWIHFARGLMWAEQAADPAQGEAAYRQALERLPQFVAAQVHLAELEIARGAMTAARARLEQVAASSAEPEALALLGDLDLRSGDKARGLQRIALARRRFEALLALHPHAFADHAAEIYLGPGADAERAWHLAQLNLAARRTPAALALVTRAAIAADRAEEAWEVTR